MKLMCTVWKTFPLNKQYYKACENSIQEGIYKLSKLFFVLIVTFCEVNGLAEVEENDANDTLECNDEAHKVVVCSHGYFI